MQCRSCGKVYDYGLSKVCPGCQTLNEAVQYGGGIFPEGSTKKRSSLATVALIVGGGLLVWLGLNIIIQILGMLAFLAATIILTIL